MLYYRVKPEYDNVRRVGFCRNGRQYTDGIWIGNELYTPKEIEKYPGGKSMCEPVKISKKQIYFCFGARFENNTSYPTT